MEHPFYSEEQYASDFYEGYADFVEAVAKRIDPTTYDPWEKVEKVMETIVRFLQERVPIVLAGYKRCRRGGCPEGSALWEIHSTPGRDGMITLLMDHLSHIIESNQLDKGKLKEKMEAIQIPISEDRSITFYHIYQNYLWLSPHPEDSIEARWGLKKCEMILSQIRSAKNSIAFIERAYRKKDPKYASFAIRQQQEILRRLTEEWDRSLCKETPPLKKKKGDRAMGR
jgi:DNA-binding FrmR family transcriptional regulator